MIKHIAILTIDRQIRSLNCQTRKRYIDKMGTSSSKKVDEREVVRPFAAGSSGFALSEQARAKVSRRAANMEAVNKQIEEIPYLEYEYPFENVAFEGGGAKGMVYVGAYRVSNIIYLYVK